MSGARMLESQTFPVLRSPGLQQRNTVAHALARALKRHGVELVFGQSLPSLLHLACEAEGIRQIGYRTENAGGYMADGFARVSGRPAIVTAQNGPAAALLVPALAEALKASTALVALVQDVNRDQADRNAFQELDHLQLFAPVTKWVRRVIEPSRAEDYLEQAFTIACSGRPGPTALLLPADLLMLPRVAAHRTLSIAHYPLDRPLAARDATLAAARTLVEAKRPLVIAGGGVHVSQAAAALAALQESAHLPVATTVMGKGAVDETHPLSIGVVGYFMGPNSATRHQRRLVEEADVILLVGTRTNQNATDSWKLYPPAARYIHIDVDGTEVGRNYEALRLVGDAQATLIALGEAMGNLDLSARYAARAMLERRISAGRAAYMTESGALRLSTARPVRPERIMQELQERLYPNSIVVADASYASIWVANGLTATTAGMRFVTPRGIAGLGWGFPMALGTKLAAPASTVWCVAGDGGFAHVWSELETAVRMKIKVSLIVLNNGVLAYQKHAENMRFGAHTSAVDLCPVDHAAIARACGCRGIRVEDPEQLKAAFDEAESAAGTTAIDVICDPDAFPPVTFYSPDG